MKNVWQCFAVLAHMAWNDFSRWFKLNFGRLARTWKKAWPNLQYRADCRLAPSQWETSLQSNTVSNWLGANLESALQYYDPAYQCINFSRLQWIFWYLLNEIQSLKYWRYLNWAPNATRIYFNFSSLLEMFSSNSLTHLPLDKRTPIPRRHFEMYFHEWKILYFDSNFTEVCSYRGYN